MKSRQNSKTRFCAGAAVLTVLLSNSIHGVARELEFRSGPERTQLIELYTSEGCSSCPPADRWLSKFKDDPGLWRDVVPVAFHVDYWNYIGWNDRFADERFSNRQRRHARDGNVKTVYTPGFVVDGREWRGWFRDQPRPKQRDKAGQLLVRIEAGQIRLHYTAGASHDALSANVAILGADLASDVTAGENANRELRHDFAVLEHREIKLTADNSGELLANLPMPVPRHQPARTAIAVWVVKKGSLVPLQATGGWLD